MNGIQHTKPVQALETAGFFRRQLWRALVPVAVGYLLLHVLSVTLAGHAAMRVSYVFEMIPPLVAVFVCFRRSRRCSGISRSRWMLVALAFSIWWMGLIVTMLQEAFSVGQDFVSLLGDFVFFIYGAPMLVALSLTGRERSFRSVILLDAVQAVMAAVLAYFVLFSVYPFAHLQMGRISAQFLISVYDCENVFLLVAASLPLLTSPQAEDRFFHRALSIFFAVYAVLVGICNHVSIARNLSTGTLVDVPSTIPFLLLVILLVITPVEEAPLAGPHMSKVALFARNANPIFFTIAVLTLGAYITGKAPYIGITAICFSLLVYCFRATALQASYYQMQVALHEANGRLEQLSVCDPLTGVSNRRGLEHALALACESAERTGEPLCLLMLDIDYFKQLNDRYGHVHGDECLVRIASEMEKNLNRSHDTLARYGGEEFAVVLPRTDADNAVRVAEKLRSVVLELFIPNESEIGHFVSLSAGVAAYRAGGFPQELVLRADRALYQAKRKGRNRIERDGNAVLEDAGQGASPFDGELPHSSQKTDWNGAS